MIERKRVFVFPLPPMYNAEVCAETVVFEWCPGAFTQTTALYIGGRGRRKSMGVAFAQQGVKVDLFGKKGVARC